MMGDDAAGLLLARLVRQAPLADWELLQGGAMPENYLHQVRCLAPEQVLIVDAAEMGLLPGAVRLVGEEQIDSPELLTTHTLPLTFLIQALREFVPQVALLGIQPEIVAFGYPVSLAVQRAVEQVYTRLAQHDCTWETLEEDGEVPVPTLQPAPGAAAACSCLAGNDVQRSAQRNPGLV